MDPTLTRADRLVGQVLGEVGALPDVYTELEINFFLLRRLLGVRTQARALNPNPIPFLRARSPRPRRAPRARVDAQGSRAARHASRCGACKAEAAGGEAEAGRARGARQGGEKQGKVSKLSKSEVLMLNIGSMCTGARVLAVRPPLRLHGLTQI